MIRTRVRTVTCPICGSEMYSRARHDFHGCKCGTMIDGGFDYVKITYPVGWKTYDLNAQLKTKIRYVNATRRELYDDWNTSTDKFGFIKKTVKLC